MNTYGVNEGQAATVADGYPDGTFRPALNVTRAQFAKMAVAGLGAPTAAPPTPSFRDVPATNHFYPWIEGGVAAGIISGYGDGTFGPNRSILRQQSYSILGSYLAQKELILRGHIAGNLANYPSLNTWYLAEGTAFLATFADHAKVAPVHAPSTAYLVYQGVVKGTASGGAMYLTPGNNLTRGQAVALILRVKAVQFSADLPAVTLLDPTGGPAAGGNSVVITGVNFSDVTSVNFGTKPAGFLVNSSTRITAVAPPGTLGTTVDVRVITHAGTSATSAASKYTYGIPTVTELEPPAGPVVGGNSVVITGTNFIGVTLVKFGTKNALEFEVDSATQITAVAPAGAAGTTVDVRVTTPGGTSAITALASKYSYGRPTITEVDPSSGPSTGGNEVVITGTGFTGVTAVKFGTMAAEAFEVDSPTQITAAAPAGVAGSTVDVTVTTGGGTSAIDEDGEYTYLPVITALQPYHGPAGGGNEVVIVGYGLRDVTRVVFGTTIIEDDDFAINTSGTRITLSAPSGTSKVDIRVSIGSAQSENTVADDYYYAPTVTAVTPNRGAPAGGNTVSIEGAGFLDAQGVYFGDTLVGGLNFQVVSDSAIAVTAPGDSAGTVDVRVKGKYDTGVASSGSSDDYTYGGPEISSISPDEGSIDGGTQVTITGTALTGASVTFGLEQATDVSVNAAGTRIICRTPAHVAGAVDVVVTTGGGSVTKSDGFTYTTTLTITTISPGGGSTEGGEPVTITGSGFFGATAVNFGDVAVTSWTVSPDGTTILCTSPPQEEAGPVNVTVVTPSGTATKVDGFEYTADL